MAGVNKAIIVGNLGGDPDIRATQSGKQVASVSIATSETWRDKTTGERKEHTDWHRVVIFNEALVKVAQQYLKKGSRVYIEGAMKTRKWTDQGGVDRYVTEIVLNSFGAQLVLLDRAPGVPPADENSYGGRPSAGGGAGATSRNADMDDDIPF